MSLFADPDGVLVKSISEATKHICNALEFSDKMRRLERKPKNFVLDTWIGYQPLIGGKTIVWYYCDVLDTINSKVI